VAVVARRLGVAPSTLRTWDRRYDLGPSERVAGAHRRYTDVDVARLLIMRRLTLEGVAPVDAASIARSVSVSDDVLHKPALPALLVQAALYPAGETASTNAAAAAIRLDQGACTRILEDAANETSVPQWWEDVIEPALALIGARAILARPGDEPETVLIGAALATMRHRRASGLYPAAEIASRCVLLWTAGSGLWAMRLHGLAAAIIEQGVGARVLTGERDVSHLRQTVELIDPIALVILARVPARDLAILRSLHVSNPELPVVVGIDPDTDAGPLPLGPFVRPALTFGGILREVFAIVR
jgi:DNA-binding transcriptional MerR regulator